MCFPNAFPCPKPSLPFIVIYVSSFLPDKLWDLWRQRLCLSCILFNLQSTVQFLTHTKYLINTGGGMNDGKRASKANLDLSHISLPILQFFLKLPWPQKIDSTLVCFVKLTGNFASTLQCKTFKMKCLWNLCSRHFHSLATISPQWWPLDLAWV